MRLTGLTRNNKWWIRAATDLMHASIGPIAVVRYRPQFFGHHYGILLRRSMEKPQHWSKGEMELFAAFISMLNQCDY